MTAIAALLLELVPLIPSLVSSVGQGVDLFNKVKATVDEDRTMTPEERQQVEAAIAQAMAVINDTSRDVKE